MTRDPSAVLEVECHSPLLELLFVRDRRGLTLAGVPDSAEPVPPAPTPTDGAADLGAVWDACLAGEDLRLSDPSRWEAVAVRPDERSLYRPWEQRQVAACHARSLAALGPTTGAGRTALMTALLDAGIGQLVVLPLSTPWGVRTAADRLVLSGAGLDPGTLASALAGR